MPGSKFADHARGNRELQADLSKLFKTKSSQEWIRLGDEKNFPVAPVNTPKTLAEDPQFKDRFPLYPHEKHGADMLPFPLKLQNESIPAPSPAPTVGENNEEILGEVLGYQPEKIKALKDSGALG